MTDIPFVRIARVQFTPQGQAYPARCERRDISEGAEVDVCVHEGTARAFYMSGIVRSVGYARGSFGLRVAHLSSEMMFSFHEDGTVSFEVSANGNGRVLSQEELSARLHELGFARHVPATSAWHCALVSTRASGSLIVLLGHTEVVLKVYDAALTLQFDGRGRLRTGGGLMVRNHYAGSDVEVHSHTLDIARRFTAGERLEEPMLRGHGVSRKALRERYEATLPPDARAEMQRLHLGLADERDEPMYLNDGVLLHPDGSLEDSSR